MKPLEFEYQVSREEWLAGLMVALARYSRNDPYRARMNVARLGGLILLAILWSAAGWSSWSLFAAAILLPLGEALIQRMFGRKAVGSTFDPGEAQIWLELSEDGLHERTPNRERRFLWTGVRSIVETGDVIAFDLVGTDFLVLPQRAIQSSQRDELERGLAEMERRMESVRPVDAKAGVRLSETAVVGRLSIAVGVMGAISGVTTSGPFLLTSNPHHLVRNLLLGFGGALAGAVLAWFAAGALIRWVSRARGERAAAVAAWVLIIAGIAIFTTGFGFT